MSNTKPITEREFLKSYNVKDFDVPLCSVDIAILAVEEGELKVLLVERQAHPHKGRWALPGGFADLKNDKTIEDTASRKLFEKTGVKSPYLEQVETIGNTSRDPRGWSVTILYFALVDFGVIGHATGAEPSNWFSVDSVFSEDMAFDHKNLLSRALERLKNKTRYTALPISLMPDAFTLSELQNLYELVLKNRIEPKSFRRRLEASKILEETGEMRPTSRRPAALYRRSEFFKDDFIFPGLLMAK